MARLAGMVLVFGVAGMVIFTMSFRFPVVSVPFKQLRSAVFRDVPVPYLVPLGRAPASDFAVKVFLRAAVVVIPMVLVAAAAAAVPLRNLLSPQSTLAAVVASIFAMSLAIAKRIALGAFFFLILIYFHPDQLSNSLIDFVVNFIGYFSSLANDLLIAFPALVFN